MVEEIEADDGPSDGLVWAMHPRVWANLRQIQKPEAASSAGNRILDNGNYQQQVQRSLLGYPVYLTTNITASTTSIIKLFDPSNLIRGTWGTVEIFVTDDGATLRSSDLVQVNGWARVDHHVKRPVSICTGTAFTY
jgi:HK97 family phage major capsid protein